MSEGDRILRVKSTGGLVVITPPLELKVVGSNLVAQSWSFLFKTFMYTSLSKYSQKVEENITRKPACHSA